MTRKLVRLKPHEPEPLAQRVTDAITAVQRAEAALRAAKQERIEAMAALAAHSPKLAEARRLYWETKTPVAEIATLLGLTAGNLPKQVAEAVGPLQIRLDCGHEVSVTNRSKRAEQRSWSNRKCSSCREAESIAAAKRRRAAQANQGPPKLSTMYLAGDYFTGVCRKHHLGNLAGGWNNASALAAQIAAWRREGTDLSFVQEMMDVFGQNPAWCEEADMPPWKVFIWKRNQLAGMVRNRPSSREEDLPAEYYDALLPRFR